MVKYDILFVSPHLDDVILSCPAAVHEATSKGQKVLIATVFGDYGQESEHRREEDAGAAALLGVDHVWMDFKDAPIRNKKYRSFGAMCMGKTICAEDQSLSGTIRSAIHELWDLHKPQMTYFPLGVGRHVDHRLTSEAFTVLPANAGLAFYEDRPYSFMRGAVAMRFAELGLCPDSSATAPDFQISESRLREFQMLNQSAQQNFFFCKWLRSPIIRIKTIVELTAMMFAPPQQAATTRLKAKLLVPNSQVLQLLTSAITSYQSQFPYLYGTEQELHRESKLYAQSLDQNVDYLERLWSRY